MISTFCIHLNWILLTWHNEHNSLHFVFYLWMVGGGVCVCVLLASFDCALQPCVHISSLPPFCASFPAVQICPISHGPTGWNSVWNGPATVHRLTNNKNHFTDTPIYSPATAALLRQDAVQTSHYPKILTKQPNVQPMASPVCRWLFYHLSLITSHQWPAHWHKTPPKGKIRCIRASRIL